LIVLDDPEDENNTKTPEAMENNLLWLLKGALPALDTRYGRCIVIGTPLHQLCIVERLAETTEWETVRYAYLQDAEGLPSIDGESIWPEMRTKESLLAEFASNSEMGRASVFYAERMCQIVGDEDQLFKPHYIHMWDGEFVKENQQSFLRINYLDGTEYTTPIIVPVNVFIGVDPASSVKQRADFSVIMPIAVDEADTIYTLDYFRKRVTPMELANNIIGYNKHYKPKRVRIESTGYQEMLRDYLKTQTEYIPGLEIKEMPRNTKSKRFEGLEPEFASGRVFIKRGSDDFINELLMFPRASHEDTIDGYWFARKNTYTPVHAASEINPDVKRRDNAKLNPKARLDEIESDWLLS